MSYPGSNSPTYQKITRWVERYTLVVHHRINRTHNTWNLFWGPSRCHVEKCSTSRFERSYDPPTTWIVIDPWRCRGTQASRYRRRRSFYNWRIFSWVMCSPSTYSSKSAQIELVVGQQQHTQTLMRVLSWTTSHLIIMTNIIYVSRCSYHNTTSWTSRNRLSGQSNELYPSPRYDHFP